MENKYYNNAIIGNDCIVSSFSEKGELLRFCFPTIDYKQFIDKFHVGLKINDSNICYLHEDVNSKYNQDYIENTNILVTNIENKYFNIKIKQIDCAAIGKNILIKKYILENINKIDLDIKFIVDSKILSDNYNKYGSKIIDNGIIQYNHDNIFTIYSNNQILGNKLNDVQSIIESGIICDKDYIGMSNEVAISYNLGTIHPGDIKEFSLCIYIDKNENMEEKIQKNIKIDVNSEIEKAKKYWNKYVADHKKLRTEHFKGNLYTTINKIYNRTILLFPLLTNKDTGGIAASLEIDENRQKSGGYSYCWPRDSIFITKAFDILNMQIETEKFYNIFCQRTQSDNGMWEQRFYTDGTLAPCWGYQIDETASVIYGIYNHYLKVKNLDFLKQNLKMCEKATNFLSEYVESLLLIEDEDIVKKEIKEKNANKFKEYKHVSYDLWEMNEGVHLYSLSSIISAFNSMCEIYELLNRENDEFRIKREKVNKKIQKMNKYISLLEEFIKENLVDNKQKTLKRNLVDNDVDISVIGSIYPFNVFSPNEKFVENTVEKINMMLRTYTGGYLRFENDNYIGGNNPWIITTLWMALYYIKINDTKSAESCFKFVIESATKYGFLAEQSSNDDKNFKWNIGLGWSHAMFIIVLEELLNK